MQGVDFREGRNAKRIGRKKLVEWEVWYASAKGEGVDGRVLGKGKGELDMCVDLGLGFRSSFSQQRNGEKEMATIERWARESERERPVHLHVK